MKGSGSQGLSLALAGVFFATAGDARADPPSGEGASSGEGPSLDLVWTAPEGCPDRAQLMADIARLLGRSPAEGATPPLHVDVTARAAKGGFDVTIATGSGESARSRDIEAPTCKEAESAAALVIAMALDPRVTSNEKAPSKAGGTDAGQAPSKAGDGQAPSKTGGAGGGREPSPTKTDTSRVAETATSPATKSGALAIRFEIRGGVTFDVAALPSPTPGLAGGVGLWLNRFRLNVLATAFPEQSRTLATGSGGAVGLWTVGLGAFYMPVYGRFEVRAGAAVEGGAMFGRGLGVQNAQSGSAPWFAALPGVELGYVPTSLVSIDFGASAVIALSRERFLLGDTELFTPPPVSLRMMLGASLRIP
ncbi:MAG: hypothetical protein U0441_11485 [Polyangiaceae bacterium]